MWLSLFGIVLAIALGLGLGAVMIESSNAGIRRYGRRSVRHW